MKVAIIGSREFNDFNLLEREIIKNIPIREIETIISGGAAGADTLAEKFADKWKIQKTIYLPDWNKHGKKAAFIRNNDIIRNADFVIAFWDGRSKGTKHSIDLSFKTFNKPIVIVKYKNRGNTTNEPTKANP